MKADQVDSVQKTGARSPSDFDALYDEYKTAVFRFAYYLTQDRREAEDLFQETWLRVIRNFPKTGKGRTMKAWIMTIVVNLHRDSLRKKRIRRLFLLQKFMALFRGQSSTEVRSGIETFNTAEATDQADLSLTISQALARLPERQRLVFSLKEIEGFKQTEISEMLKMPIGTVKSLMYRAVRQLRQELLPYKPEPKSSE